MNILIDADLPGSYKVTIESAGYRVIVGIPDQQRLEVDTGAIALVKAENALVQLKEWRRRLTRLSAILVGDPMSFFDSTDLTLAAAPTLLPNASTDYLLRMLAFLAHDNGWLLAEMGRLDRGAKQLVADECCEWVRSRSGIIGIVKLARFTPPQQLTNLLRRLIEHAYTLLDNLPQERLSVQDIWNVTLLIAVPTKESELDRDSDIAKSLDATSRDLTGSRKVVLWFDQRIDDYFGPLGEGRHVWKISTDDPLRRTLERLANDPLEREALESIFKKRLSQDDIDELLRVLSRHS